MKPGVTHKLFLLTLTAAGLAVICAALIMQWSVRHGFLRYVNSVEKAGLSRLAVKLEEIYAREHGWRALTRDERRWRRLVFESLPLDEGHFGQGVPPVGEMPHPAPQKRPDDGRGRPLEPPPPMIAQQFDQRLFLLDVDGTLLLSHLRVTDTTSATPLRHRGTVVGYLGIVPRTRIFADEPQRRFLKEQEQALALTAGVVVLLAAILSLAMARRLVRPLRELAAATHRLAAGEFSARVPITSGDELGRLATDFNSLALTLQRNEQSRRQWVADISHELRTPLAILQGEIEALQDGIRQPTPETLQSLHAEALHLGRLVDDLYQLSLSDMGALTYRKSELDLRELLSETVATFRPEFQAKGIDLELVSDGETTLFADPERLRQLFVNLLKNSLRYTDAGGTLGITLHGQGETTTVDFQDSAPGVPEEEMERLFERLYRADSSRNRSTGGVGLGLAICRNIVEAHAGTITAHPSSRGGVWIHIEIPRTRRS